MDAKIKWFLIIAAVVIAGIVLFEQFSKGMGKRTPVPFEYSLSEYAQVDKALIAYREVRQISIPSGEPKALTIIGENLVLLTSGMLHVITPQGREVFQKAIEPGATRILATDNSRAYIAYKNYMVSYDDSWNELYRTEIFEESFFVSLARVGETIYVADGWEKKVLMFNEQLQQTGSFKGESGVSAVHGFILPGQQFDMAVNYDGELWVVNPGLHTIQNYSPEGRLRGFWGIASFGLNGFSGCCNPSYMAFLSDGRYVTSEKGMVRVKIHKQSGEFETVVAAPEKFGRGESAPALAVDGNDNIWLLDFDKKMIRLFTPDEVAQL